MKRQCVWDLMRIAVVVIVSVQLTGCASIIGGTRQDVTFNSSPPGATVMVDGASGVVLR